MAHIALFARMLAGAEGGNHPPHATTSPEPWQGFLMRLQGTGWVARVVADQEGRLGGRQVGQAVEDANGNPLVMVNVLAHDLRLCLAQWPASEKREPCGNSWPNCSRAIPACTADQTPRGAPGHSRRRTRNQGEPARGIGGVCRGGTGLRRRPWKKAGVIEKRRMDRCGAGRLYPG